MQVDDTDRMHNVLYSDLLIPRFRLLGSSINIFWDGTDDSKDSSIIEMFVEIGFSEVAYELLRPGSMGDWIALSDPFAGGL